MSFNCRLVILNYAFYFRNYDFSRNAANLFSLVFNDTVNHIDNCADISIIFKIEQKNFYLRSQDGVVLQRKVVVADPWRFTFTASSGALIGSGKIWVASQLSCGAVCKVQVPEG